jgi:hypothetical protein
MRRAAEPLATTEAELLFRPGRDATCRALALISVALSLRKTADTIRAE